MENAELDPARERFRRIGADLGSQLRQVDVAKDMEVGREDEKIPRVRAHRRAILGIDQKRFQYQIPRPCRPSCRLRELPWIGITIWSHPSIRSARRLRLQGRTGPCKIN